MLRDFDTDLEISRVNGDLVTTRTDLTKVDRDLLENRKLDENERGKLTGQKRELEVKLESLTEQLGLLKEKQSELTVKSPIDGYVVTWDVENRLKNRPVNRGQLLMRVADLNSKWELELHAPDNRMGHITRAYNALEPGKKLNVQYQLATAPGTTLDGEITEIHKSAEVRGEEGNTVLIKVAVKQSDLSDPRPGASVTGKVYCGRRSLGYTWFHDVFEFVESRILFRYF